MEKSLEKSAAEHAKTLTLGVLQELLPPSATRQVGFRLWDGTRWPDDAPRSATIVLNHPGALRAMLLGASEVVLGEAYLNNDFDIEGTIETVFPLADAIGQTKIGTLEKIHAFWELSRLPVHHEASNESTESLKQRRASLRGKAHSPDRDRAAIAFHYNAGNDFYALWLDHRMVYSCAYFRDDNTTLEEAQRRKLEHICRKLNLQRGEKLLDIGCGWGGLIIYAAQHHGVEATGITLSEEQWQFAHDRISDLGLSDRCHVELCDYREIEGKEQYDKLVSVGMVEHVGRAMLPTYFAQAYSLLRPGGVFMNHGIGVSAHNATSASDSFVDTYVFPDGELVPIHEMLRYAETAQFEVRDVENLREHYARTLRKWVQRLEANHDKALRLVDEPTYRIWRLYMAGSAYGFDVGNLELYQSLLCKNRPGGHNEMPLTRDAWYAT